MDPPTIEMPDVKIINNVMGDGEEMEPEMIRQQMPMFEKTEGGALSQEQIEFLAMQDEQAAQTNEQMADLKHSASSTQIGFMNVNDMSGGMKLLYILGVFAFFGLIIYVIMKQLTDDSVDFQKQKRQKLLEKRANSGNKKSK